jgi:hypothetical protein
MTDSVSDNYITIRVIRCVSRAVSSTGDDAMPVAQVESGSKGPKEPKRTPGSMLNETVAGGCK